MPSGAWGDRPYLLRIPGGAGATPPLVLELHGRGIDPIMFDRWTGFSRLADEMGFVLAMPRSVREVWNDGRFDDPVTLALDDVGYLSAVVRDATARAHADPRRVYVVGMSNGATMAARLVCERDRLFAGIAQVGGTASVRLMARARPSNPLPILSIHGTTDRYAPYAGGRASDPVARLLIRHRTGPAIGLDDWARFWIEVDGAGPDAEIQRLGPDTTVRRWRGSTPASDIDFYRIEGAGHTWPGVRLWTPPYFGRVSRTFDATRVIWDSLARHRREG